MKKFDKRVKPGTKVLICGQELAWKAVKEVHPTRKWIKVDGMEGSFQVGHVKKFKNSRRAKT